MVPSNRAPENSYRLSIVIMLLTEAICNESIREWSVPQFGVGVRRRSEFFITGQKSSKPICFFRQISDNTYSLATMYTLQRNRQTGRRKKDTTLYH